MLIDSTWEQTPIPIDYSTGIVGFAEGPGACEARCHLVRMRCGEDTCVAVGLALRFSYSLPKCGVLRIEAGNAPNALRAGLLAWARGETTVLPDAVFVGTLSGYAGLDLSKLEVLSAATHNVQRAVAFTVGPVKRSAVETFLRHQAEEAKMAREGGVSR